MRISPHVPAACFPPMPKSEPPCALHLSRLGLTFKINKSIEQVASTLEQAAEHDVWLRHNMHLACTQCVRTIPAGANSAGKASFSSTGDLGWLHRSTWVMLSWRHYGACGPFELSLLVENLILRCHCKLAITLYGARTEMWQEQLVAHPSVLCHSRTYAKCKLYDALRPTSGRYAARARINAVTEL